MRRNMIVLSVVVFIGIVVILLAFLSTGIFSKQGANIGGTNTAKSPKEIQSIEKCSDAQCFWNKAKGCEKAAYTFKESAGNIETKLKLEVIGPEKGSCKISVELLGTRFLSTEGLDEKVVSSIQSYFDEIAGSNVVCKFSDLELEKNPFVNSSFITKKNCSGKLKKVMLNLESEIEKRILGESG